MTRKPDFENLLKVLRRQIPGRPTLFEFFLNGPYYEKLTGKFDWVQVFVTNKAELDKLLPRVVEALKPESLLWITFPKAASKIQTDLTRDKGWDAVRETDLKWTNLVSVNDTWSAFSLRPYKPGEERQAPR